MDTAAQPGWTFPFALFFIYIFAPLCVVFAYYFQHLLGPEERDHAREEHEQAAEHKKDESK